MKYTIIVLLISILAISVLGSENLTVNKNNLL